MKQVSLWMLLCVTPAIAFSAASSGNNVTAQRPVVDLTDNVNNAQVRLNIEWSKSVYRSMHRGVPARDIPPYAQSIFYQLARIIEKAALRDLSGLKFSSVQVSQCELLKKNLVMGAFGRVNETVDTLWKTQFINSFGSASKEVFLSLIGSCLDDCPATVFLFQGCKEVSCLTEFKRFLSDRICERAASCQKEMSLQSQQRLERLVVEKERERLLIRQQEVQRFADSCATKLSRLQSFTDNCFNEMNACAQEDITALSANIKNLHERAVVAAWMSSTLVDRAIETRERRMRDRELTEMIAANAHLADLRQRAAVRDADSRQQATARKYVQKYRSFWDNGLAELTGKHLEVEQQMVVELPVVMQKVINRQQHEIQAVNARLQAAQRERDFAQHQAIASAAEVQAVYYEYGRSLQIHCPGCGSDVRLLHCNQSCCPGGLAIQGFVPRSLARQRHNPYATH